MSYPIVVLVSGEGSNLQALIDILHGKEVEIVGVAASRAEARGLQRAQNAGIQTAVFAKADYGDRSERDAALADWIESLGARLVVLAGFMEILHGARSKKIKENSYDGLGAYAIASDMRRADILARVDELIEAGQLASTGGKFPKLKVVPPPTALAA